MNAERRRTRNVVIAVVVVAVLVLLAVALSFAGSAGFLPWQPEPTRIPITPFADLPGAGGAGPGTPVP
jgi:hypothetical protein